MWRSTQMRRFLSREVREISRFFVAPPCVFAPAVRAALRWKLLINLHI